MFCTVKKRKRKDFCRFLIKGIGAVLFLVILMFVRSGNFLSTVEARDGSFGCGNSVTVEISFSLEVLGRNVPESNFRVYLERDVESPNNPLPEPFYLNIHKGAGREKFYFHKMKFSREGVYRYRIKQEKQNQEGFSYDDTEYNLEIEVLRANIDRYGNVVHPYLYAVVTGKKTGEEEKVTELSFVNSYQKEEGGKVNFLPQKPAQTDARKGVLNRTAKRGGGDEEKPLGAFLNKSAMYLRIARRKLKGEGSRMALYALSTALATGNVILWLYRVRYAGGKDTGTKDSRKKEK